ncbi:cytochrome c peroxidase [uncultured Roseibium sp.]|uniref:cytochrome-c peroxidase n=1 Tax=uncultured Roseibium sp. TaxID=1936171 RepID=UPI002602DAB7|nr:cytochrome c peroxidase [uncultured Roseibium sp.]
MFTLSLKAMLGSTVAFAAIATATAGELPNPLNDTDYLDNGTPEPALVELGRMLFFDPILSGNRNISCGTCHDPGRGTGDGVPLSIGEGGEGFGAERRTGSGGVTGRVPRNAQPLYNIGARSYRAFFHDGRLEPDPAGVFKSGFWSPAREHLPEGLVSPLAAQAMFPVLSPVEMAGQKGENPVATAVAEDRPTDAWDLLADRLSELAEYREMFRDAFGTSEISFVQAANALAAFQAVAFRSNGSPFEQTLRDGAFGRLSDDVWSGVNLFYGRAGCDSCHSGPLLTDHSFHAIAMPQTGPGKGHGADTSYWRASGFMDRLEDEGRFRITFEKEDLFAFRTPSLLNVALTGPWGHSGAFDTLEAVVRHHLEPEVSLNGYRGKALPELDAVIEQTGKGSRLIFRPMNPARRNAYNRRDSWVQSNKHLTKRIADANDLAAVDLSDREVGQLVAFLEALTDPAMQDRQDLIPVRVPSRLPPQPPPHKGK